MVSEMSAGRTMCMDAYLWSLILLSVSADHNMHVLLALLIELPARLDSEHDHDRLDSMF